MVVKYAWLDMLTHSLTTACIVQQQLETTPASPIMLSRPVSLCNVPSFVLEVSCAGGRLQLVSATCLRRHVCNTLQYNPPDVLGPSCLLHYVYLLQW